MRFPVRAIDGPRTPVKLDPRLLVAHIRASVGARIWKDGIRPYPENASLFIGQTQDGHARMAVRLATLRSENDEPRP